MSSNRKNDPSFFQILDGISAAFDLSGNHEESFEEWLGHMACHDLLDDGDRVIKLSTEAVANVIDGRVGVFTDLNDEDRNAIMVAHQFLQNIGHIRSIATDWGITGTRPLIGTATEPVKV